MFQKSMRKTLISVLLGMVILSWGCASSTPDPRCSIDAPEAHVGRLAKTINKSALWKEYFKEMGPEKATLLAEFTLDFERVKLKGTGGSYDPGFIKVYFLVTQKTYRVDLFEKEVKSDITSFIVGRNLDEMSREEVQALAFEATEKEVFPYLEQWVDIAAMNAML